MKKKSFFCGCGQNKTPFSKYLLWIISIKCILSMKYCSFKKRICVCVCVMCNVCLWCPEGSCKIVFNSMPNGVVRYFLKFCFTLTVTVLNRTLKMRRDTIFAFFPVSRPQHGWVGGQHAIVIHSFISFLFFFSHITI
jgi:hypothetical protein